MFGIGGKPSQIGIVAGLGEFPKWLAEMLMCRGMSIALVIVEAGDSDRRFEALHVPQLRVRLREGEKAMAFFKEKGFKHLILAGKIPKAKLYEGSTPEGSLTDRVLKHSGRQGDRRILQSIDWLLKLNGFRVWGPHDFLPQNVMPQGPLTDKKPEAKELASIQFGRQMAKAVGRLDIGQAVVVKESSVVAVEAMEGTDEMIRRSGKWVQGGILVKAAKPGQDLRFDMPVIGPETVQSAVEAGLAFIAAEAGKCLIFKREEVIKSCVENSIGLYGF